MQPEVCKVPFVNNIKTCAGQILCKGITCNSGLVCIGGSTFLQSHFNGWRPDWFYTLMHSESLSIVAECAQAVSVHGGVGGRCRLRRRGRTTKPELQDRVQICPDIPEWGKKKNQTSSLNRLYWSEAQSGGERFLSWTKRLRILSAHWEYWWEIEDNTPNYHSMVVAQNNDDIMMKNKGLI